MLKITKRSGWSEQIKNDPFTSFFLKKATSIIFCVLIFCSICKSQTTENYKCPRLIKEKWMLLSDSGKYDEAIKILFDTIHHSKAKNKLRDYWHLGQLYACVGRYDTAIVYLRKSTNFFNKLFDREWRLYFKGTIAFLKKDQKKLTVCYNRLWKKHSAYYESNACKLKLLYDNYEKPYKTIYSMNCK